MRLAFLSRAGLHCKRSDNFDTRLTRGNKEVIRLQVFFTVHVGREDIYHAQGSQETLKQGVRRAKSARKSSVELFPQPIGAPLHCSGPVDEKGRVAEDRRAPEKPDERQ